MDIQAAPEDFMRWISEALRVEIEEESEGVYAFDLEKQGYKCLHLRLSEVESILLRLSSREESEETAIYDERSYEVLIKETSHFRRLPRALTTPETPFVKRDDDNNITYIISVPSDEYLLFLLHKLSTEGPLHLLATVPVRLRLHRLLERQDAEYTILDIAKLTFSPRLLTLRIETGRNKTLNEFVKYADAFFFQISYNLDTALIPQRFLDELVRSRRIMRVRRSRIDELEPPRRSYISDLIHHYQMAVASDSPPLEYLSYYHIAEHFFEAVFHDALIERVRNRITLPDFSYKRKRDIKSLINEIGRSLQFRGENVTFSDLEALKLTLERHVDVSALAEKIREYDESLIEHYRTSPVSFSNGDRVDLEDNDHSKVLLAAAKRIYKTRNAIVHSKESERGRYIPFRHDRVLVKEVPLLRFISELIIIESSTVIS